MPDGGLVYSNCSNYGPLNSSENLIGRVVYRRFTVINGVKVKRRNYHVVILHRHRFIDAAEHLCENSEQLLTDWSFPMYDIMSQEEHSKQDTIID